MAGKRRLDYNAIAQDIRSRKMNQTDIAKKHGCGRRTICRISVLYGISPGQGMRFFWNFIESSPELAYLVGIYLTEGYIGHSYPAGRINKFEVVNTSSPLIKDVSRMIANLGLRPIVGIQPEHPSHKGNLKVKIIHCYSVQFARWLHEVCIGKNKIPDFVFSAPLSHKLEFLAAAIDGDGCVSKNGTIRIRVTQEWIKQLPLLLSSLGIRTGGVRIIRILDSGKPYYNMSVNRMDFRAIGGKCHDQEKQRRVLVGKEPPWSSRKKSIG